MFWLVIGRNEYNHSPKSPAGKQNKYYQAMIKVNVRIYNVTVYCHLPSGNGLIKATWDCLFVTHGALACPPCKAKYTACI
jgi:hypothetical protein